MRLRRCGWWRDVDGGGGVVVTTFSLRLNRIWERRAFLWRQVDADGVGEANWKSYLLHCWCTFCVCFRYLSRDDDDAGGWEGRTWKKWRRSKLYDDDGKLNSTFWGFLCHPLGSPQTRRIAKLFQLNFSFFFFFFSSSGAIINVTLQLVRDTKWIAFLVVFACLFFSILEQTKKNVDFLFR